MAITIIRKTAGALPALVSPRPKPKPEKMNFDGEAQAACALTRDSAVPWFLMASYLYYVHDRMLVSDEIYDALADALLEGYEDLAIHHHRMMPKEALAAHSMRHLQPAEYPLLTKGAACRLAFMGWDVKLDDMKGEEGLWPELNRKK